MFLALEAVLVGPGDRGRAIAVGKDAGHDATFPAILARRSAVRKQLM